MIHRAPFGSMERFVAVLIEHTAGEFPLWLAPDQAVIIPISDKYQEYAEKVCQLLKNYDIRTLIDNRSEKVGKKIRDNELKKIPYLIIVGEKEETEKTISVRRHREGDLGSMTIDNFIKKVKEEIENALEPITIKE